MPTKQTVKFITILKTIGKTTAFVLIGLLMLLAGVLVLLYSPWVQDTAREAIVKKFSEQGTHISLDSFRLRFPLCVDLGGLAMTDSRGDTLVAARSAHIDAALLPLLKGKVELDQATLRGARYVMGSPDSAMYMTIAADSIALSPASVRLADMGIELEDGAIRGGRLNLYLNPDTTAADTTASQPTKMSIALGRIRLEDFTYAMRMMPTIDTLRAHIPLASLRGGTIDLEKQTIALGQFSGSGLDAKYIAPDSAAIAAAGPYPQSSDTTTSKPWTVTIDSIGFSGSRALYTTAGTGPLPGLDFAYIAVDSLNLQLHDFYNQASTVRLPISLQGTERCGVCLDASGTLDISESTLTFKNFKMATPNTTSLAFEGLLGMGDMAADPSLPVALDARGGIAPGDLGKMFPAFLPYFASLPAKENIELDADVSGTMGSLDIKTLDLTINRCVSMKASGTVENVMNPDLLGGKIDIDGRISNVTRIKDSLMPKETARTINVPPMTLRGNINMDHGTIGGRLTARTGSGAIKLDGRWNSRRESYTATVNTSDFPVDAFMPLLGVGDITAQISAKGKGYSPFLKSTTIDADLAIDKAEYMKYTYTGITGKLSLADGNADLHLGCDNPSADFTLDARGNLDGKVYTWTAELNGNNVDLQALHFSDTPANVELTMNADATIGPSMNDIKADVTIADLFFRRLEGTIAINDVRARLDGSDSLTTASIHNRDLAATFSTPCGLDTLGGRFALASATLSRQIERRMIDVDSLQKALPHFNFNLNAGASNLINDVLAPSKMSFRNLSLSADNDSTLSLDSRVVRFTTGETNIDTITFRAAQHHEHLHFAAGVRNRPGTLDALAKVNLDGKIDGNTLRLRLDQENIQGKTGFRFGLKGAIADSALTVNIEPHDPIIGYQQWTVNADNFISYFLPTKHIDANISMSGGNSSLAIYTEEADGSVVQHNDSTATAIHSHDLQEDLVIKVSNIHISDWIALNPFAPPMKGDLGADLRLNRHDGQLMGRGSVKLDNFLYDKQRVASLQADFDVAATTTGTIRATADVLVDGVKTMTLSGALNDSTAMSPMNLDFSMIRFPLATVNPFLPRTVGRLSGMLNGTMQITGTQDKPILNGYLDFDSTAVRVAMTATEYRFSEVKIPVTDNIVQFNNFAITACNDNPLNISGKVDIRELSNPSFDLRLNADNMQIVNSRRLSKGADIYGKAYIDLAAKAHGSMSMMNIDANLKLLPGTNVTYVIPEGTSAIASQSQSEMVKFVNFADSANVLAADSIRETGMAMFLNALLTIEEGTTISVDLSPDGKNKVQLQSSGTLNYTMTPLSEGRLSGRLNINKGFGRYSPPFMSEKLFNFNEGSYVAFNGDMMNPTLNIHATDVIKANVTQEGSNSRLVDFDVILSVTGTLNTMNVAFDLTTNDDITVANELQAMSAEQRANQAMNMLLYNVYTGPGTKGNASLAGNPLFSFLESQINSWAANTIKGVDISFGINQYDKTVDGTSSQTMSYSYQVSKSLFNDRFKIVVGGNYSTDANADENFSQNLISDISFEYFLNDARTMYVRLFRHTGYESILEGEITQTGVGFVYRRKILRLSDMFRFRKSKPAATQPAAETETSK